MNKTQFDIAVEQAWLDWLLPHLDRGKEIANRHGWCADFEEMVEQVGLKDLYGRCKARVTIALDVDGICGYLRDARTKERANAYIENEVRGALNRMVPPSGFTFALHDISTADAST